MLTLDMDTIAPAASSIGISAPDSDTTTEPNIAATPTALCDVYEYLRKGIGEYANSPPNSEFDSGYLDAMKDAMEDCFGVLVIASTDVGAKAAA